MSSIRPAGLSDVEQLLALYIELHEFTALGVPARLRIATTYDDEAMRGYMQKPLDDPSATCLVAVDGDRALGFAEAHIVEPEMDSAIVPTRRAHLQSLLVTEECRGGGIGSQLLAAAEKWARSQGAAEMDLDHFGISAWFGAKHGSRDGLCEHPTIRITNMR